MLIFISGQLTVYLHITQPVPMLISISGQLTVYLHITQPAYAYIYLYLYNIFLSVYLRLWHDLYCVAKGVKLTTVTLFKL